MDFEFDDHVYRMRYPDVAAAVARGRFRSSAHHFSIFGSSEQRFPNAITDEAPRIFAAGAFGTQNIGDDAIFRGLDTKYPGVFQLYINTPSHLRAIEIYSMIRGPNRFRPQDHLVIGGGGLLYGKEAVQVLLDLATRAAEADARITIEGIGCEGLQPSFAAETKQLFSLASYVSVRTTRSHRIVTEALGLDAERRDDFAFALAPLMPPRKPSSAELLTIGIVTGGDVQVNRQMLTRLVSSWTSLARASRVRFVHIPQSVSLVDYRNNDEIVGARLRADIGIFLEERSLFFTNLHYPETIEDLFETYSKLDGIITERFHGMIFAELASLPIVALTDNKPKFLSFCEDYASDRLFVVKDQQDLSRAFDGMLSYIATGRRDDAFRE